MKKILLSAVFLLSVAYVFGQSNLARSTGLRLHYGVPNVLPDTTVGTEFAIDILQGHPYFFDRSTNSWYRFYGGIYNSDGTINETRTISLGSNLFLLDGTGLMVLGDATASGNGSFISVNDGIGQANLNGILGNTNATIQANGTEGAASLAIAEAGGNVYSAILGNKLISRFSHDIDTGFVIGSGPDRMFDIDLRNGSGHSRFHSIAEYAGNKYASFGSLYTDSSLVHKGWIDSLVSAGMPGGGGIYAGSGAVNQIDTITFSDLAYLNFVLPALLGNDQVGIRMRSGSTDDQNWTDFINVGSASDSLMISERDGDLYFRRLGTGNIIFSSVNGGFLFNSFLSINDDGLLRVRNSNTSTLSGLTGMGAGSLAWNTDSLKIQVYDGSAWANISSGAGTQTLSITGDSISISEGNTAALPLFYDKDINSDTTASFGINSDNQVIAQWKASTSSIEQTILVDSTQALIKSACPTCDNSTVTLKAAEKLLELKVLDNTDTTTWIITPDSMAIVSTNFNNTDTASVVILSSGKLAHRELPILRDELGDSTSIIRQIIIDSAVAIRNDLTAPAVSLDTAISGTLSVDFGLKEEGVFDLFFDQYANTVTLSLSNPRNGGEYTFWFEGCSNDTITFPNNFLSKDRDSLKTRLCTTNEIMQLFYDGTNYVTPDTLWAVTTVTSPGGGINDPTEISGLVVWYDPADSVSTASGAVDTLWDKSGLGHHIYQTSASNRPAYGSVQLNSLDIITFDGTDDYLSRDSLGELASGNDFTIFVVGKQDNTEDIGTLLCTRDDQTGDSYKLAVFADTRATQKRLLSIVNDDGTQNFDNSAEISNTHYLFAVKNDFTSGGGDVELWRNGTSQTTGSWTFTTTSYKNDALILGNQFLTTNILDGDIAEVIIYNRILTSQEIDDIEQYISNRWGIF